MHDEQIDGKEPKPNPGDDFGCLVLLVAFLVCSAVPGIFAVGNPGVWGGMAALALAAFGVGVVWITAHYRRS